MSNDQQNVEIKKVFLLESDLPKWVMEGFASAKTKFALHVHGTCGPTEIRNIISLLELQAHLIEDAGHDK